jgi:hypothetical protein
MQRSTISWELTARGVMPFCRRYCSMMAVTSGSGMGLREPGFVPVPAGAGFWPKRPASHSIRHIGEVAVGKLGRRRLRSAQPMSSPARSPTRNGPIAMPKSCSAASICCGNAPAMIISWAAARVSSQHAVADEAVADAGHHGDLAHGLRQAHGGRQHVSSRLGAAHHFEQAHHIGRAEEMQPITSCGRRVKFAISSRFNADVLEARIAPWRTTPSSVSNTWRFTSMLLEHGFDARSTSRNAA